MLLGVLLATVIVIDGDTVQIDGERIRIANIDAPEIHQAKCDAERRLAEVARSRLKALMSDGTIDIERGDPRDGRLKDRSGRTLARVYVEGQDVGRIMIDERLARPWTGKRQPWCEPRGR